MRFPHTISNNVRKAYKTCATAAQLLDEINRNLRANHLYWEPSIIDRLTILCVKTISLHFEKNPILRQLPSQDKDLLLDLLSTDLPLPLTIPLLDDDRDDYYWHRCYIEKYGKVVEYKTPQQKWKSIYLERHVRKLLEEAEPEYKDEFTMQSILKICSPYVFRLVVKELKCWKPSRTLLKKELPDRDTYPTYHINFIPVLKCLRNIEDLIITIGMRNVGMDYNKHMFEVAVEDCQNLGKALLSLKELKRCKIHRCNVKDEHIKAFIQPLLGQKSLMHLDLSNCKIGDLGARCLGNMITVLKQLQVLILKCNLIGAEGANGLAYGLMSATNSSLTKLDISLNPLCYEGIMPICSALLRCAIPAVLNIGGCGIEGDTGTKVGSMLKSNSTLRELDITNNYFGEEGGKSIVLSMKTNTSLMKLDMRNTSIPGDIQATIRETLLRNYRNYLHDLPPNQLNMAESDNRTLSSFDGSSSDYYMDWVSASNYDYSNNT